MRCGTRDALKRHEPSHGFGMKTKTRVKAGTDIKTEGGEHLILREDEVLGGG